MREHTNRLRILFCLLISCFPFVKPFSHPTKELAPNCCGQSKEKLETFILSRDTQKPYQLQSKIQRKYDQVLALSMPSLTSEKMEPSTKL